jgi:CRISPR-associated endoribonuclease Cas6
MLTIYCLEVIAEAATPLVLDPYCGSALRGAFFRGLWGRFCTNREASTCEACPLVTACPVASLVAPLRDEAPRGQNIPRPYILMPPYKQEGRYEQGEIFPFGVALIGTFVKMYPYVMRALQEMEHVGLGHPLVELHGKRGKISIREVHALHSITGEKQMLWQQGEKRPEPLRLCVTPADIAQRAEQFPIDHVNIHFTSPTRLIANEHMMHTPDFSTLVLRLAQRVEQIQNEYALPNTGVSENAMLGGKEWYSTLKEAAAHIKLENDTTQWADIQSHSTRQKRQLPTGGIVGRVSFVGDMKPFRELLAWGEILRIGKNIVKGGGAYHVEV